MLKKQIILPKENETETELKSAEKDLLNEADFSDNIPASVGKYTTKDLAEKVKRSS